MALHPSFHFFLALPLLWLHQKAEGIVVELTVVPASDASNTTKPVHLESLVIEVFYRGAGGAAEKEQGPHCRPL